MNIQMEYQRWCKLANRDPDLPPELQAMANDEDLLSDAFYRDLAFGTGGLRGEIGAGTNRMNVYTVAKASQGVANYLIKNFAPNERRVAISRDSRHKSDLFAQVVAEVLVANGIKVWLYREIMPTPCLSFAVRQLHCAAGIMITASHNPAQYNGYKVYGVDGCQITTKAAAIILKEIAALDIFTDLHYCDFTIAVQAGKITYISEQVTSDFITAVLQESPLAPQTKIDRQLKIVYSPLNGTGLHPVTTVLKQAGFTNIFTVPEQRQPDGDFPTCPLPNPEIPATMALGIAYARQEQADFFFANDPDCDRVGIAVKNKQGDYVLLSGNEIGLLLLDYICSQRVLNSTMPLHPEVVKTIVTTDLAVKIAKHYGVQVVSLLTGFKFIGEEIGRLEKLGRVDDYLFGFEESYGYLSGTYVRDKDGVNASFLICEMFVYYKTRGISLLTKLAQLYKQYGYCLNTLHSFEFKGQTGRAQMTKIMARLRQSVTVLAGQPVVKLWDYQAGINGLPPADVLKFQLPQDSSVVVRPSGTEPKLKLYISIQAADQAAAKKMEEDIKDYFTNFFQKES
ncbi:phospho-sugar mutase [Lactobacillus sp. DCY120]|uniref:Phosphoglucomutase n=1 Tax=Bombilactobacillus apium TaxID=2675299 RepID=A0A850R5R6_9LACO|nr:phospho-sugar mutase [Bombilactobacillus apium]NVY96187.1 phospho-sugar mutase [Bombilactobacillus apium]